MPGLYKNPTTGETVQIDDPNEEAWAVSQKYTPVGEGQRLTDLENAAVAQRGQERGVLGTVNAGLTNLASGLTAGESDVFLRNALGPNELERVRNEQAAHPIVSESLNALGTALPALASGGALAATPMGLASRAGAAIAEGTGGGALRQIGRAALGTGVEGTVIGTGQGISKVALSDDPLTVEHAMSTIGTDALMGLATGGLVGGAGKGIGIALGEASNALKRVSESVAAHAEIPEDLASLDAAGLRAAKQTEQETIRTAHEAETAKVETARVAERQSIADDVAALRREVKDTNQWATTKDVKLPAAEGKLSASELGKVSLKADRQLANILDNPIGVAKNPARALDALQRQENALTKLLDRGDELKAAYGADEMGGKRLAALEAAPQILEKNRALQARIAEVAKPLPSMPATSPRLEAIEAAKDALAAGGKQGVAQKMLGGAIYSGVAGAVRSIPVVGNFLAPFAGAQAADLVGQKVLGRLAKGVGAAAERTSAAIDGLLGVAQKTGRAPSVVASKILSGVAYAPPQPRQARGGAAAVVQPPSPPAGKRPAHDLTEPYLARTAEIRSQVQRAPDGSLQMRPEARMAMARKLDPIRMQAPVLADRMETLAAKRLTFLADKIGKVPDMMATVPGGADSWLRTDQEMRKFARYVSAVEDPNGILERAKDGTMSTEDAETLREVYPEMLAKLTAEVMSRPDKLAKAPYHAKLALTMLTGIPVDPALHPRVLSTLQAQFANEPGTAGGMQAPRPSPQFGSVSNQEATPAQKRGGNYG